MTEATDEDMGLDLALKLDLGCGRKKHPGVIGFDHIVNSDADIIHDLNDMPWPVDDNSVGEIYVHHILEHLDDLDAVMLEIHRICKNGARIHIIVPNFYHFSAIASPHHKHFFIRGSFDYYDGREDFPRLFRVVKNPSILYNIPLIRELPCFSELRFELEVVK